MLFQKFLLTALGGATAAFSAIAPRCGQASSSGQLPGQANSLLKEKDANRDPAFLTPKSHSKSFHSIILQNTVVFYTPENTPLTGYLSEFVVNGTAVPEVDFDLGESYAGRLPIVAPNLTNGSSNNELFFWFFPSKNPAASNEITVFLNGGPGCSSMGGLLQENGPFQWQPGTYSPQRNPFSWANLTNMVWIDQPIGKHFSNTSSATPFQEQHLPDALYSTVCCQGFHQPASFLNAMQRGNSPFRDKTFLHPEYES